MSSRPGFDDRLDTVPVVPGTMLRPSVKTSRPAPLVAEVVDVAELEVCLAVVEAVAFPLAVVVFAAEVEVACAADVDVERDRVVATDVLREARDVPACDPP